MSAKQLSADRLQILSQDPVSAVTHNFISVGGLQILSQDPVSAVTHNFSSVGGLPNALVAVAVKQGGACMVFLGHRVTILN